MALTPTINPSVNSFQQPRSIEELPSELWVEIIASLAPRDIISLSTTCRLLRTTLHQKGVWISFLRAFCLRERLFQPSYSFDTTNLPALQRAASAPDRWERLIEKHHANDSEYWPNLTQLEPVSIIELPSTCKATRARLVPGGRFLVTAGKGFLQLWDLGPVGTAIHVHPNLLSAEHRLKNGDSTRDYVDLTVCILDETTLRVAVATSDSEMVVEIFDVSLRRREPAEGTTFVPLASLRIAMEVPTSFWTLWLSQSRIYIQNETCILWDFTLGQYTLLSYRQLARGRVVGFTGSFIALIDGTLVSIWSVPFKDQYLSPVQSGVITVPDTVTTTDSPPPDCSVDLSLSRPNDSTRTLYFILPSTQLDPGSLMIEAIEQPPSPNSLLSQYKLIVKQDSFKLGDSERGGLEAQVQHVASWTLSSDYERFAALKRIGGDGARGGISISLLGFGVRPVSANSTYHHFCLCTVNTHGAPISSVEGEHASTSTISPGSGSGSSTVTMTVIGSPRYRPLDVCSVSGRAVLQERRTGVSGEDPTLYIYDYLTWDRT